MLLIKKTFTIAILTISLFTSCDSAKTSSQPEVSDTASTQNNSNWEPLFDGKTGNGWHSFGKDSLGKAWKIEDSALHLDASVKKDWQTKDGGDIVTDKEFENFDLKLKWKISEGGNSGIMFYVKEDTAYQYPWNTGPEMQVADNDKNEDGKIERWLQGRDSSSER